VAQTMTDEMEDLQGSSRGLDDATFLHCP